MKKIIVSHKRADKVTTHRYINDVVICVPESQKLEYEKYNDCEIISHPDSVVGLSPKRQWIIDNFKNVFQLDDDIVGANRVYIPAKYSRKGMLSPQEISDWIDDLEQMCNEIGVKLFGFNRTSNPAGYSGDKPISFNKYITGGAFGLLEGHGLHFPDFPYFVGEDYWINALNAHINRKSLIDQRVAFSFVETEANVGGVADYRTEKRRKETYIYLKKHFGDAIIPKIPRNLKKHPMKWEKTLKVDF